MGLLYLWGSWFKVKSMSLPLSQRLVFFFPPKRNSLKDSGRDVCASKASTQSKKGKNNKTHCQKRMIVTTFPGQTYGVESKLMLLACVDDADLWLEEKTGRLGEAWITWSTRWPTDDGRSRVPSCTNSEFLTNTRAQRHVRSREYSLRNVGGNWPTCICCFWYQTLMY